jgi:beta-lactamase regulating signal transducer with metallopeptidase domain
MQQWAQEAHTQSARVWQFLADAAFAQHFVRIASAVAHIWICGCQAVVFDFQQQPVVLAFNRQTSTQLSVLCWQHARHHAFA